MVSHLTQPDAFSLRLIEKLTDAEGYLGKIKFPMQHVKNINHWINIIFLSKNINNGNVKMLASMSMKNGGLRFSNYRHG